MTLSAPACFSRPTNLASPTTIYFSKSSTISIFAAPAWPRFPPATPSADARPREGIQAFSRALLAAGSRSALTTLWRVPDQPTSEFMQHFYFYLLKKTQIEVGSVAPDQA